MEESINSLMDNVCREENVSQEKVFLLFLLISLSLYVVLEKILAIEIFVCQGNSVWKFQELVYKEAEF